MLAIALLALASIAATVPLAVDSSQQVLDGAHHTASVSKSEYNPQADSIARVRPSGSGPGMCNSGQLALEMRPGHVRCVSEDDKWTLKREGHSFFDITNTIGGSRHIVEAPHAISGDPDEATNITVPDAPSHRDAVKPLLKHIDMQFMRENLYTFTMFHNRYYKSQSGLEASMWLHYTVWRELGYSGACDNGATMRIFEHSFEQRSLIARIPGRTKKTVVVGAHLDDLNLLDFSARSPGADDNGSGVMSVLAAMRAILHDQRLVKGDQENTLEFHFYAANEGGFLGSLDIYEEYRRTGRDVRAMLNLDMTGWTRSTLDAGVEKHIGLSQDFVHLGLTEFTKQLVDTYLDIPWKAGRTGWAASDHSSANKFGFPSAGAMESLPRYHSPHSLAESDTITTIDFSQMHELSKLAVAFAYELMSAGL